MRLSWTSIRISGLIIPILQALESRTAEPSTERRFEAVKRVGHQRTGPGSFLRTVQGRTRRDHQSRRLLQGMSAQSMQELQGVLLQDDRLGLHRLPQTYVSTFLPFLTSLLSNYTKIINHFKVYGCEYWFIQTVFWMRICPTYLLMIDEHFFHKLHNCGSLVLFFNLLT